MSGKQAWASEILYRLYKRLPSSGECQKILVSQPGMSGKNIFLYERFGQVKFNFDDI